MTALEHVQVVGVHQATTAEELLDMIDTLRPAWHARAACRRCADRPLAHRTTERVVNAGATFGCTWVRFRGGLWRVVLTPEQWATYHRETL